MNEELEKVKGEKVLIRLNGKDREIKFGFSAWAKLEKEYGDINKIEQMQNEITEKPFETLPHLLFIGIVDKDKEGLSEETLLDEYGMGDIQMITEKLSQALWGSLPQEVSQGEGKKGTVEAKN